MSHKKKARFSSKYKFNLIILKQFDCSTNKHLTIKLVIMFGIKKKITLNFIAVVY